MYATALGLGATPSLLVHPSCVSPSRYNVNVDGSAAVATAATWAHWPAGGKKAGPGVSSPFSGVPPFLIHHIARRVVSMLRR